MSERMSRREMRKAGLLKAKREAEERERATLANEPDTAEASDNAPAGPARATIDRPDDEPTYEEAQSSRPGTDRAAAIGDTAETEAPAPVGAESPASVQTEDDSPSQGSPERTSVFDRFSTSNETESRAVVGVEQPTESVEQPTERTERAELAEPAVTQDDEGSDEDYAGALRARLKSQPPVQDGLADEDVDEPEPSRWKTILLFLILIIVGFGVGIFLGSLIFAGGDSASAPHLTDYIYPGAL